MGSPKISLSCAVDRALHLSLRLALALGPALAIADQEMYSDRQWSCGSTGGQWQCSEQETTPGPYPPAPKLAIPAAPNTKTAAPANTSEPALLDWQPMSKQELLACKKDTTCGGAYVAPERDWPDAKKSPENAETHVSADHSTMVGSEVKLDDNVVITRGWQKISADHATLNRETQEWDISGNIEFREPGMLLRCENADLNSDNGLGEFSQLKMVMHDSAARIEAGRAKRVSVDELQLDDASYTRCPPSSNLWALKASDIDIDDESGWGKAKHARLYIKDVPVFYSPFLSFPVDDRRMTGFLWPSVGSSGDNGFDLALPLYLNLAPNYDATITPRHLSDRGTMGELEMRYLNQQGSWVAAGAKLPDDELTGTDRWLGALDHHGRIGTHTQTRIDYTKVSDNDYFSDLQPASLEAKSESHLLQEAEVNYVNGPWLGSVSATQFQTIDDDVASQYKKLPQWSLEHFDGLKSYQPEMNAIIEGTSFEHDDSFTNGGPFVVGDRLYGEASVGFPVRGLSGFIVPTAKVRHISYELDSQGTAADTPVTTVASGSLDMGLFFEREFNRNDSDYIQTLEPRLYYLYSEYESQDDNPNFDTANLDFSYYQLFRDTRFSGHDRISDANQASIGLSSRFIEADSGRELLRMSAGQIFYFDDREVGINPAIDEPENTVSNSEIAGELQYAPTDSLWLNANVIWDSRQDYVNEGGFGLNFSPALRQYYNLGYRYRRDDITYGAARDLKQADASVALPLARQWSLYARYLYDLVDHQSMVDMVGIGYEDCCWLIRLVYQRAVDDQYIAPSGELVVERDHVMLLQFQLKGLGGVGGSATGVLEENIFGFKDFD